VSDNPQTRTVVFGTRARAPTSVSGATTARAPDTDAKPAAASDAAILVTTFIAGLVGSGLMYWTWRGVLEIPFVLTVGLHIDPASAPVRPWAPWWVPVAMMCLLTMLLWRLFVARRRRASVMAATALFFVVSNLTYVVATLCLNYGAALQYVPTPPVTRMLAVLPLALVEGAQMAQMYFVLATPIGWALLLLMCAIIGGVTVAIGRLTALLALMALVKD
jgi:hypothetical protein